MSSFQEPPDISLQIYTALRAADQFYATHGRHPGTATPSPSTATAETPDPTHKCKEDAEELARMAGELVEKWAEGEELASLGIEEASWREPLANACAEV